MCPCPLPWPDRSALIVAIAGEAEFHVTWLVMFAVLASLYVPVAVNCPLVPLAIEPFAALMAIDCRTAAVTVNEKVFDVTPLMVAVMFDVPVPAPMARPPALIVAIVGEAEFHVTWLVMFAVLASL